MKNKDDKKRVLDFLRGELPIEDLESELLAELASAAREEYTTVTAENLELKEKIKSLEDAAKDLNTELEEKTAELDEATNRVKEYKELEKTRVSERKETLLASIKEQIKELGLKVPEDGEESPFGDLGKCQLETLEQMNSLLNGAELTDLTGLQQNKPEGESDDTHDEENEEETDPGDAMPENEGSEEPKKPHVTLEKIRHKLALLNRSKGSGK